MKLSNLFRPNYVAGRLRNWLYQKCHPDHPWLTPESIRWLDANLPPGGLGFEWGSGRSTAWLARRLSALTSVEHNEDWFAKVQQMLEQNQLTHATLRYIPLDHPEAGTYETHYDPLPRYAAEIESCGDESLDFVLVDGWYRAVCARAAIHKLKPGALLAIDNTDWQHPPHIYVPSNWPIVHQSRNVLTQTTVWSKP